MATLPPAPNKSKNDSKNESDGQLTGSWKTQLPMAATYSRIIIAPLLFLSYALMEDLLIWGWLCAVLFTIGSISDGLDGYWARLYHCETNMGKLMDPVADKILVLAGLVLLLYLKRIDPFIVFLFVARDIFIGGLRSVAAANQMVISAKPTGKWKTGFQMVAVPTLLVYDNLWGLPFIQVGLGLLWLSLLLSLLSAGEYGRDYYLAQKAREEATH